MVWYQKRRNQLTDISLELRRNILEQERLSSSNNDNVTTDDEIHEFYTQMQEITRETYEQSPASSKMLIMITEELEKLNALGDVEENDPSLQLQQQQHVHSSTYDGFRSDLDYIQSQTKNNNDEDDGTYSIGGNAELEIEKESQYPEQILPHNVDIYHEPQVTNDNLFNKVRGNLRKQREHVNS
jgi:hypothetical protein